MATVRVRTRGAVLRGEEPPAALEPEVKKQRKSPIVIAAAADASGDKDLAARLLADCMEMDEDADTPST